MPGPFLDPFGVPAMEPSLSAIEARLERERATASEAERAVRAASARYATATKNAAALDALLKLARAFAAGEALPAVRDLPY